MNDRFKVKCSNHNHVFKTTNSQCECGIWRSVEEMNRVLHPTKKTKQRKIIFDFAARKENKLNPHKAVLQIKENNVVAIYRGIHEASLVSDVYQPLISAVINGRRQSAGGYKWELAYLFIKGGSV